MKKIISLLIRCMIFLTGCNENKEIKINEYKIINQSEAYEMMNSQELKESLIILDVRNEEEFAENRIDGAINIPLLNIENKISSYIPDKDTNILVYCKSGVRAQLASEKLVSLGYTNVFDIGGIDAWEYGTVNPIE